MTTTQTNKQNPVQPYDNFVMSALHPDFTNNEIYQRFLQACKDMLEAKVSELISGRAPYIYIPSDVSEQMAQQVVQSFNDAGGWLCAIHYHGDEPWIEFRKNVSE
ncbi:MAG: hypothetical protein Q8T09_11190 [Candidatus Melainabacteria bacterium]|nr:hypothetical protein [Candidatus Melainabacteria bacterium]